MPKKNPAEEFLEQKSKQAAAKAEEDLHLWHAWDQGGRTPELLRPLMSKYQPVLARSNTAWRAPAVSPSAFDAELRKHFIGAAETFDPDKGVAFNTHVQTRLQKAKRYNTRYQNIGYIPEGQARYIGALERAQSTLTSEFGRAPKPAELAEHMGLPVGKITSLQRVLRKDVPSSMFETDPTGFSTTREADVIRLMQRRPEDYFSPEESAVFKHIYGLDGSAKITDTTTLASRLGLSQPKVSRLKSAIANTIKKQL